MTHIFVYPSSLLKATRVDEHFNDEAGALTEHDYVLWVPYENRIVRKGIDLTGATVIYRGWIITVDEYRQLETLVENAGGTMLVNTDDYARSQFAEGWLNTFADVTPKTSIYPYGVSFNHIYDSYHNRDQSFVVKGSSKSLKHDWAGSMFAAHGSDVARVLTRFRSQVTAQEESTILIRDFEQWLSNEWRVFWINGEAIIQQHPQNTEALAITDELNSFVADLKPLVESLGVAFVTTDVVRTQNDALRVVEVGNGQVSQSEAFNALEGCF